MAIRPDAMICTGRSDYPNQVNNVLCFPYIFRGALDVGASTINEEMKRAAVNAIAGLARETPSDVVARAYGGETRLFGKDFADPRALRSAPDPARGARRRQGRDGQSASPPGPSPISTPMPKALQRFVFRSGFVMRQIFAAAKKAPKRVIYADGEDERVLRAAEVVLEEGIAKPDPDRPPGGDRDPAQALWPRPSSPGRTSTSSTPRTTRATATMSRRYVEIAGRRGITPDAARTLVRTSTTVIAALALQARRGGCDDLRPRRPLPRQAAPHPRHHRACARRARTRGDEPDDHLARHRLPHRYACAGGPFGRGHRRHGADVRGPRGALRHHAQGGARLRIPTSATSTRRLRCKMRKALGLIHARRPDLEIDGEMQADTALIEAVRQRKLPSSTLKGEANLLVMPDLVVRQRRLPDPQGLRRCPAGGPDPAGHGDARPYPHRLRHLARCRQHDGDCRCRGSDSPGPDDLTP